MNTCNWPYVPYGHNTCNDLMCRMDIIHPFSAESPLGTWRVDSKLSFVVRPPLTGRLLLVLCLFLGRKRTRLEFGAYMAFGVVGTACGNELTAWQKYGAVTERLATWGEVVHACCSCQCLFVTPELQDIPYIQYSRYMFRVPITIHGWCLHITIIFFVCEKKRTRPNFIVTKCRFRPTHSHTNMLSRSCSFFLSLTSSAYSLQV
jgi:hypothetical protein